MEAQNWTRSDGAHDMQYTVRASSAGRCWNGLDAALFETSGGRVEFPEAARYNIGMHVGRPVVATCQSDGPIQRRLQTQGDIDIIPLGFPAAWEDAGQTTVLSISLTPTLVRSAVESMGLNFDTLSIVPHFQLRDAKIEHVALALKAELEALDRNDRLYAEGLGLSLAIHLVRRYSGRRLTEVSKGLSQRRLRQVLDYISQHLASDLTLAELAAQSGISASHFKSLFKQSMGLPVHQYIIKRRVDHAMELLVTKKLSLGDVAFQAGFSDQSHMARCMRKVAGVTPTDVIRSSR